MIGEKMFNQFLEDEKSSFKNSAKNLIYQKGEEPKSSSPFEVRKISIDKSRNVDFIKSNADTFQKINDEISKRISDDFDKAFLKIAERNILAATSTIPDPNFLHINHDHPFCEDFPKRIVTNADDIRSTENIYILAEKIYRIKTLCNTVEDIMTYLLEEK